MGIEQGNGSSPPRLIGREEAARRLDVSVPTLRRMEATQKLRPMVGPRGAHLYNAGEVEALAQARIAAGTKTHKPIGEIAAEAFTLFEQGYSVQDAVMELRQSPDLIRRLLQEYLTGFGEPADVSRERAQHEEQELEKLEAQIDAERDRDIAEFERRMRAANAELERECKREAATASRRRGESDARRTAFWGRYLIGEPSAYPSASPSLWPSAWRRLSRRLRR